MAAMGQNSPISRAAKSIRCWVNTSRFELSALPAENCVPHLAPFRDAAAVDAASPHRGGDLLRKVNSVGCHLMADGGPLSPSSRHAAGVTLSTAERRWLRLAGADPNLAAHMRPPGQRECVANVLDPYRHSGHDRPWSHCHDGDSPPG